MNLRDKLFAALATRFEKPKATVKALISLDEPVFHYGRITCLVGNELMSGHDLIRQSEDSRDASFIKVGALIFCGILY
jgi:hypothetical protein